MKRKKSSNAALPPAGELKALPELQQELAHLFPSIGALQWELRTHRERYVRGGAIFELRGRIMAHPSTFQRVMVEIASEKIAAGTGRAKGGRA